MSSPVSTPAHPRLVMTLGDPSGIGPELVARLLSDPANRAKADVSVLASAAEIEAAAAEIGVTVPVGDTADADHVVALGSELADLAVPRAQVSQAAGERAMSDLRAALARYQAGDADAIMFAPLNKSALHLAGMDTEDELRWFADLLGFDGFTSELNFVPGLTTSRVTSHMPLSEVAVRISARAVLDAIRLLHEVVRGSGVEAPRLAVCALNPHAGENGQFGHEEIDHIAPGIALARNEGIDATGPFPCDTIFIKARDGRYDGVVTMYHDQGQIAMKLLGFDIGVTVQGGLPVPIATPAHGTAHEIVGTGKATIGPTQHAFDIAVSLAGRTRRT